MKEYQYGNQKMHIIRNILVHNIEHYNIIKNQGQNKDQRSEAERSVRKDQLADTSPKQGQKQRQTKEQRSEPERSVCIDWLSDTSAKQGQYQGQTTRTRTKCPHQDPYQVL